jgi:hypothetical protein
MSEFDPIGRLEDELRAGRPQLDSSLEHSLVAGVAPRRRRGRTAAAVVLTTATVGALGAFGGVGYAHGSSNHGFTGSGSHHCYGGNHHQNHHHQYGNHHHHHNW